ncbi:MAG: PAS domain S-box protein [Desulfomonile tiedjei]|nr:PAS domain S-box protein [Desulfomonile tiedjei]
MVKGSSTANPYDEEDAVRVRAAQIRQLYTQSRAGMIAALIGAVLLVLAFWDAVPRANLIGWFVAFVALQIPRHLLWYSFRRTQPEMEATFPWGRWFAVGSGLTALLWGLSAVFLFPEHSLFLQCVLLAFVAGVAGSTAVAHAPLRECYVPSILLSLLPLGGRLLFDGGDIFAMMSVAVLVLILALIGTGGAVHRMVSESIRLRFEKDDLLASLESARQELEARVEARTRELSRANERLEAEVAERVQAERRLNLLSSAVEQSSEGLIVADLRGTAFYLNEAFAEVHHYTRPEVIGHHISVFHTPEQMAAVEQANRQVLETGEFSGEIWHARRDGTNFPTLMHNSVLRNEAGEPIGIIGTMREISELKRWEEDLKLEKQRLQSLSENAPFAMVMIGSDGRFHYVNPKFVELFGYNADEVPDGRTWFRKAFPDRKYRHDAISTWLEDLQSCGPGEQRSRILLTRCKDGKSRTIHFRPVQLATGEHVMTCEDITERHNAELALRESEERFRTAFHTSPDAIIISRLRDSVIVDINEGFTALTGYSREAVIGQTTLDLRIWGHELYRERFLEGMAKDGQVRNLEAEFRLSDGRLRKGLMSATIMTVHGEPHILAAARDIHDWKEALEALRESEQRLELALKGADLGLWDWNIVTGDAVFDQRWAEMLEYPLAEVPTEVAAWRTLVHTEDLPRVTAAWASHSQGRTPTYEIEHRMRTRSGNWKWVLARGKVVEWDPTGRPVRATGTHLDITQQKKLAEERDRLFNLSLDMLAIAGFDGFLKQLNPAWQQTLGWTREELLARPYLDLVHPEDRRDTMSAGERLRTGKAVYSFENRYQCKDGSYRWISWNSFPLPEEKLIFAVARDITEHKRSQEELAKAQALLSAAIEQTPAGIIVAEAPDATIIVANSAALEMRCKTVKPPGDEPVKLNPEDWTVFHPDGAPFAPDELPLSQAVRLGETVKDMDAVVRHSTGEERWVLANAAPVRSASGEIVAGVVVFADITDRKKAEEELRRSEEKYRTILETIADGYHEVDLNGNLTLFNNTLCKLFGYSREELLGTNYRRLMDERTSRDVFKAYNEVHRTGVPIVEFQFSALRKDGTSMDVSCSISSIRDSEGRPAGFRGIFRDITERKLLEAQVRQSAKMEAIGRLAGGVAHDFNNLLTAMIGYSDLLMQMFARDSVEAQRLSQISRAAERAAALTQQLLAFSRKQVLDVRTLNLNDAIAELQEMLTRLIGEDIELVTHLDESTESVLADRGQIQQILMNLVVNARDAMPSGGRVTIETTNAVLDAEYTRTYPEVKPGRYAKFTVSDDGHGMDTETLSRVFEPFFTTKEKGVGTGLGLSTVYGIVKQHGGHVTAYSEPGQGTTFSVYLPRTEAVSETISTKPLHGLQPRGTETILVVEDEAIVRDLACEALEMLGYSCLAAATPLDAITLTDAYEAPIHLLLTDVVLPQMDGRSLFNKLSPTRPDMKVLYVSGHTEDFVVHHGILERGVHFMQKPFNVDALARKLREILDERGDQRVSP